jgi:hypothetical protein
MLPSVRTIDELYPLVSYAIHRAEVAEARGDHALALTTHLEVADLEAAIAALLPPHDGGGAIARRGAVGAALDADQPSLAKLLAEKYLSEDGVSDSLRDDLRGLRTRALFKLSASTPSPILDLT